MTELRIVEDDRSRERLGVVQIRRPRSIGIEFKLFLHVANGPGPGLLSCELPYDVELIDRATVR